MQICTVCVDLMQVKQSSEFACTQKYFADNTTPPLTPAEIEADISAAIAKKLGAPPGSCPGRCPVYLVLVFHLDPKPILSPPGVKNEWDMGKSVKKVLDGLAGQPSPISEVYLKSCASNTQKASIKAAFGIPTVKEVYTVDNTIFADCADYITGATYPTFKPQKINIQIWTNPTAKTDKTLESKEKYNIKGGSVTNWAGPKNP